MFFSRDGDFIKEIKVPRKLFEISLMGENFLGKSEHIDSEKEIIYYNISLLDKKSDTLKDAVFFKLRTWLRKTP